MLFGEYAEMEAESDGPYLIAATRGGQILRTAFGNMAEPSNRNGRAFMRLDPNDEVLGVEVSAGDENVCLASRGPYVFIFPVGQVSIVRGAARGVRAIRAGSHDAPRGLPTSGPSRQ